MDDTSVPQRYVCFAVDVQGYSGRGLWDQDDVQAQLRTLLTGAAADAGLDRLTWHTQDQGDSELALIPSGPDEPRVIGELVRFIDARLGRYNAARLPQARLRLRVSIHNGWARRSAMGFAGDAVVAACRLLEAEPVRSALAAVPSANLALIVSAPVFDVIRQGLTTLDSNEFRAVPVGVKEFSDTAWLWTPVAAGPDRAGEPPRRTGSSASGGGVTNHGVIITGGQVSGPVAAGEHAQASITYPPAGESR